MEPASHDYNSHPHRTHRHLVATLNSLRLKRHDKRRPIKRVLPVHCIRRKHLWEVFCNRPLWGDRSRRVRSRRGETSFENIDCGHDGTQWSSLNEGGHDVVCPNEKYFGTLTDVPALFIRGLSVRDPTH